MTPVPNLEGLVPTLDYAVSCGSTERELLGALRADGTPVLEVSISGKKICFVSKADLATFIVRNAQKPETNTIKEVVEPTWDERMARQAAELENLREQISRLKGLR